ncbi:MAG: hypothetical protein ACOVP1_03910 [Bacteroidia bacterium]
MARPSLLLIEAFRKTAKQLLDGKPYEWGHMGACNCGNLAQTLLNMSKADIHHLALTRVGNWSEQLNDYCPSSGFEMDKMIFGLLEKGLSTEDLQQLEFLSNKEILQKIGVTSLQNNKREDVAKYLMAWAEILEEKIIEPIEIKELQSESFLFC